MMILTKDFSFLHASVSQYNLFFEISFMKSDLWISLFNFLLYLILRIPVRVSIQGQYIFLKFFFQIYLILISLVFQASLSLSYIQRLDVIYFCIFRFFYIDLWLKDFPRFQSNIYYLFVFWY